MLPNLQELHLNLCVPPIHLESMASKRWAETRLSREMKEKFQGFGCQIPINLYRGSVGWEIQTVGLMQWFASRLNASAWRFLLAQGGVTVIRNKINSVFIHYSNQTASIDLEHSTSYMASLLLKPPELLKNSIQLMTWRLNRPNSIESQLMILFHVCWNPKGPVGIRIPWWLVEILIINRLSILLGFDRDRTWPLDFLAVRGLDFCALFVPEAPSSARSGPIQGIDAGSKPPSHGWGTWTNARVLNAFASTGLILDPSRTFLVSSRSVAFRSFESRTSVPQGLRFSECFQVTFKACLPRFFFKMPRFR